MDEQTSQKTEKNQDPEFYRGKACAMSVQHTFQVRPDNIVRCIKCWMPWSIFIKGW